jgi:hypothetical protein
LLTVELKNIGPRICHHDVATQTPILISCSDTSITLRGLNLTKFYNNKNKKPGFIRKKNLVKIKCKKEYLKAG